MATYEGAWDCPHCGRQANRGPEKHCGGCGTPRGENVPFYLPEDAREVVEAAELARANSGPDWTCAYCQGDNPNNSNFCTNCGAGKDGSKPREVVDIPDRRPEPPPAPAQSGGWWKGCLGCLGLMVLFFIIVSFLNRPTSANLKVQAHLWQRAIATETYGTVSESAWEGEVPTGARERTRSREVHHTDHVLSGHERRTRTVNQRVQDGTERVKTGRRNKGNGYFEDTYTTRPKYKNVSRTESYDEPIYRDVPIYRYKVHYDVDKWSEGQAVQSQGEGLTPAWPAFSAGPRLREKSRSETYSLRLADPKQKNYVYTAKNEAEWRGFQDGQTYPGKVRGETCLELRAK